MDGKFIVLIVAILCLLLVFILKYCKTENFAGDDGYYQITWDPPTDSGGSPISYYTITIKDGDDTVVSDNTVDPVYDFGKSPDATDVGKWNTDYDVTITATNENGQTSDPTTYSFNSKDGPGDVKNIKYTELTTESPISSRFTVTFNTTSDIEIDTDGNKTAAYLKRDGKVICKTPNVSIKSDGANLAYAIEFMGFDCDGLTRFLPGDFINFSMQYENDQETSFHYVDRTGYTIQSDKPSPVTNITAKYIS